jgi:hypothetical protein
MLYLEGQRCDMIGGMEERRIRGARSLDVGGPPVHLEVRLCTRLALRIEKTDWFV